MPAYVPLPDDPSTSDPRFCRQSSEALGHARQGRLTAGSYSEALGFFGSESSTRYLQGVMKSAETPSRWKGFEEDDLMQSPIGRVGSSWGRQHEMSAVLTYLTAYLLPRCSTARLLETGFWPLDVTAEVRGRQHTLGVGASPDALIEGAESLIGPGGAILEAKCPFAGGNPRALAHIRPRQLPQIQGGLLSTGRSICHVISWAPSGAAVFEVAADADYQEDMHRALAAGHAAATESRPLSPEEDECMQSLRFRSKLLASQAALLARISEAECVQVVRAGNNHGI